MLILPSAKIDHEIWHLVGHLNTILAQKGGNLNKPIFKRSNAIGLLGKWGGDVEASN